MNQVIRVAIDLLLEAARRKWFLALFGGITAVLVLLGACLELDVVDGTIAGSKLFGAVFSQDIVSTKRALGGVYVATAYLGFYGGALFLSLSCSDFATELLAPGRIEHLLSLPIARWQLLFGTFLGVISLALLGALYGAGGITLLLGSKTGEWNFTLLWGAGVGWVGFVAMYAVMLTSAFFVRSAALSGALGVTTLVAGIFASFRESISVAMKPGVGRVLFSWLMLPFPRLGTLATVSARLAADEPFDGSVVAGLLAGCFIFSAALLSIAAFRFERRDF
jgi:Cu-processing system permease protein